MRFEVRRRDTTTAAVVEVTGELDIATIDVLQDVLRETPKDRAVVMDLCETSFIDSSGLRLLLLERERRPSGLEIACARPSSVARILEVAGVASLLPVHADRDAALAALPAVMS